MTNDAIAAVLSFVAVLAAGCFLGFVVGEALKTREFSFRDGCVHRDKQPVAFWCWFAFYGTCMAMLAAIGVYSLWRLFGSA